jgi:DnaJ-class molecular chaperone
MFKMDENLRAALATLGFVESVKIDQIPKMKTVTKKYHKLAMIYHPDRLGGDGDQKVFKEISAAYLLVGNYLEEHWREDCNSDSFDFEEDLYRKTFHQFQNSNMRCQNREHMGHNTN